MDDGKNPEPKLEILWLYLGGHVDGGWFAEKTFGENESDYL